MQNLDMILYDSELEKEQNFLHSALKLWQKFYAKMLREVLAKRFLYSLSRTFFYRKLAS